MEKQGESISLQEIRRAVNEIEVRMKEEIERTGQSWFSCFRTTAWKTVPTLLDTARLRGDITEDQEVLIQNAISGILNIAQVYEKESGSSDLYRQGVPSDEVKGELLGRFSKILDLLKK